MVIDGDRHEFVRDERPGWVIPVLIVLALVALVGAGTGWWATSKVQESRHAVSNDIQEMKRAYDQNIEALKQGLEVARKTNANLQDDVSMVRGRLQATTDELRKAREEAHQILEEQEHQLAVMDSQVQDQLASKANVDDVRAMSGEMGGVRTELNATKRDVQMARSEMGTLIARNHEDIETLRRLGEREYTEFTIAEKNKPVKVGDVTMELRSTDPKKNQCNLTLVVSDKRTEKRNRSVNEPIFFYVHGEHRPMEVVINQVEKNKVAGYVSVPRAVQQPATSASSGGN